MADGIQDLNETFVRVIVVAKLSLFLGGGGGGGYSEISLTN